MVTMIGYLNGLGERVNSPALAIFRHDGMFKYVVLDRVHQPTIVDQDIVDEIWEEDLKLVTTQTD